MALDMKEISKDILMRSKQDVQKRPEFITKQHQLKTAAIRKQEEREKESSNELMKKLKSRSDQIEQVERQQEEEANAPEFLKVKLKPK